MTEANIRIALVEDDAATRARLVSALQTAQSVELVAALDTVAAAKAFLAGEVVDVMLVDLGLPDGSGLEVISYCRSQQPSCDVMVITMFGDEANMMRAFESGARGYVLKDGTEADLAGQIDQLRAGGSPMSPIIARRLLDRIGTPPRVEAPAVQGPSESMLSQREQAVLDHLARGFTYAEAAKQLSISPSTVQTHVKNIYAKLAVHSKTEAIFEARQLGLLP
jgi:DNA-binding NarL/FixJ family response regulator